MAAKWKNYSTQKDKDLDFSREDFGQRVNKERPLVVSPKRRFDPLKNCDLKPLRTNDFAEAINKFPPKVYYILQHPSQSWILSENLFQQKLFNLK